MTDILIRAARAAHRQKRILFVYGVAYKGLIISDLRPPVTQKHIAVHPDGHLYQVENGTESHMAKYLPVTEPVQH